jgi:S1-C subfamily serine protease
LQLAQAPRPVAPGGLLGLSSDFRSREEVRIGAVAANGPAAKAGLKVGDCVLAVDGKAVKTALEFAAALFAVRPGAKVELTVQRDGKTSKVVVQTAAGRGPGSPGERAP